MPSLHPCIRILSSTSYPQEKDCLCESISSASSPAVDEQLTAAEDLRVDIINDLDPEIFRREYIDRCIA